MTPAFSRPPDALSRGRFRELFCSAIVKLSENCSTKVPNPVVYPGACSDRQLTDWCLVDVGLPYSTSREPRNLHVSIRGLLDQAPSHASIDLHVYLLEVTTSLVLQFFESSLEHSPSQSNAKPRVRLRDDRPTIQLSLNEPTYDLLSSIGHLGANRGDPLVSIEHQRCFPTCDLTINGRRRIQRPPQNRHIPPSLPYITATLNVTKMQAKTYLQPLRRHPYLQSRVYRRQNQVLGVRGLGHTSEIPGHSIQILRRIRRDREIHMGSAITREYLMPEHSGQSQLEMLPQQITQLNSINGRPA